MADSIISYEEWAEKYKPLNDTMFDTVDEVMEISQSPHHIWTVVDNNPNSVYLDVLPGYRLFNRMGFYVTEIPWKDGDMVVSNETHLINQRWGYGGE